MNPSWVGYSRLSGPPARVVALGNYLAHGGPGVLSLSFLIALGMTSAGDQMATYIGRRELIAVLGAIIL